MSYTRVFIFEPPKGFTHHMKVFRSETKPMLDKLKKEKTIVRWSLIKISDSKGMFIFEFANKTQMNRSLKTMAAHRNDVIADNAGMQWWAYHGSVKTKG